MFSWYLLIVQFGTFWSVILIFFPDILQKSTFNQPSPPPPEKPSIPWKILFQPFPGNNLILPEKPHLGK